MDASSNDNFRVVTRRRPWRGGLKQRSIVNTPFVSTVREFPDCPINKAVAIRRILSAKDDLESSDYYKSFLSTLDGCLSDIQSPGVVEIVSLGLGHVGDNTISRYQLSLLLCLREKFKVRCYVHDPIFYTDECDLLQSLGLLLIEDNEEGKRQLRGDGVTIVYLPHCPKQLTNNFLWKNWSINLKNCVLICNSFAALLEQQSHAVLDVNAPYILNISAHTVEYSLVNSFKYHEVFNDTAIHTFPYRLLKNITPNFWEQQSDEPNYSDDVEFISSELIGRLKTGEA